MDWLALVNMCQLFFSASMSTFGHSLQPIVSEEIWLQTHRQISGISWGFFVWNLGSMPRLLTKMLMIQRYWLLRSGCTYCLDTLQTVYIKRYFFPQFLHSLLAKLCSKCQTRCSISWADIFQKSSLLHYFSEAKMTFG